MKKKVPRLKTDRQAEAFLAQDLSNLDFSQFKAARVRVREERRANQHAYTQTAAGSSEGAGKGAWYPLYAAHSGNARKGNGRAKVISDCLANSPFCHRVKESWTKAASRLGRYGN